MKTRTRWLRRLLWLTGFGCLWLNVLDDPPLRTGAYVQDVTDVAATVAKITATPTQLHLTVFDGAGEAVADIDSSPRRRHALRAEGLRPGVTYSYSLTSHDDGEELGTFKTAPKPGDDQAKLKFAFVGDSGDQAWWVWLQKTPIMHLPSRQHWLPPKWAVRTVGAAMAEYQPDFALHLGDVIYPKGLHAHYSSGYFRPFGELIRNAPMYVVVGNHDVMNAAGQQVLANFQLPDNQVTGDERCYSFARGPVRIISLDSNTWFADDVYKPDHPTHRFLLRELARCTEPWIVVAGHHPIRSASRQGHDGRLQSVLLPELERQQVSIYLSGHDHCYQRFGPNERWPVPMVVSGGGGKRLYDITEDPRPKLGAESLHKAYHWCGAEVSGRLFRVVARDVEGRALDTFELALPAGDQLRRLRLTNPARAARIDAL
ncbi:MAG: putative phosphodiesterase [Planctomycetota bacterium]